MIHSATDTERRPTPEEQERALNVMDAAERLAAASLTRHGGKPVTPESWEILAAVRDERSQELR